MPPMGLDAQDDPAIADAYISRLRYGGSRPSARQHPQLRLREAPEPVVRFLDSLCRKAVHAPSFVPPPPPSQQLTASGRAGRIGINTAGQFHFAIDTLPWGAHPSETLVALESGQGWTKNTLGVVGVDKVRVLPAP